MNTFSIDERAEAARARLLAAMFPPSGGRLRAAFGVPEDPTQIFAGLGPNVKVRRVVVPEGGSIEDAIKGVLAEISADFKAEDTVQNGVNAVSVDTACDCPACAPTPPDAQNGDQDSDRREDPLANLFRSRVKRLVEAFVAVAYPEVDVWISESNVGNSNGYTFDLHVTGIDDFDTAETITITIPDNLMMTATNLELSSGLTGVLNYVGASINNLVD